MALELKKTLGLTIEELLALETEPEKNTASGKPSRKIYLESGLPESVQKAIKEYLQGEKEPTVEQMEIKLIFFMRAIAICLNFRLSQAVIKL